MSDKAIQDLHNSPRRNRVDPWGDLQAVRARGMFTGNRGCVVDDEERVVRHHSSSLWIVCRTEFKGWRWPLARPRRWTPLFFLDDAVALAAGHRPCATCRRDDYRAYRDAVTRGAKSPRPLLAKELNARLQSERLERGRGLERAHDRKLWPARLGDLPRGAVVVGAEGEASLWLPDQGDPQTSGRLHRFSFEGWQPHRAADPEVQVRVLTPPTSVLALGNGYRPTLHQSSA